MAKTANQKMKIVYLMQIFREKTDETHGITMADILRELENYGISAERKSIYADMEALNAAGFEIAKVQENRETRYYLLSREFEVSELKLLVDAIQSSKFITEKKSRELIRKMEKLTSAYEAKGLERQVYVAGRIKTMNETIYYNVDEIHRAISENRKIQFQYFRWTRDKKQELRHGGQIYHISPWGLSWDDENYYMIGYDSEAGKIKHYRVDKMLSIRMSEETREGKEYFQQFDMAAYARQNFGMFGGEEADVTIELPNDLAGVIIDRFGKNIMMVPEGSDRFRAHVHVAVSLPFFGWVFSLGEGVKIVGPDWVVEEAEKTIQRLAQTYDIP